MIYCSKDPQTHANHRSYLEGVVNRICATYEDKRGINHIEGYNLPGEEEILHILGELMEIIFPGFSGRKNYAFSSIKYHVGEILSRVFIGLCDQVSRSFRFNCARQECDCESEECQKCDVPKMTEQAVTRLLDAIPVIREAMKLDVAAAHDGDPAAKSIEEILLSYPGIKAISAQRLAHVLYQEQVPLIPRMMCEHIHGKTGIDIHPGATIGEGVFIDHGTGVVIGETCDIGDGVKIYQGVTLGALSFPKDACGKIIKGAKRHPTIGNNVTIYAGATILGNIVVGEGSIIGGNVWLTESVPPGTKITIASPKHTVKTRS